MVNILLLPEKLEYKEADHLRHPEYLPKEWSSFSCKEMGGSFDSAPACYGSSLSSNPDIYQKFKMGGISIGVANTLQPARRNMQNNY
jgi:hypothetical protein